MGDCITITELHDVLRSKAGDLFLVVLRRDSLSGCIEGQDAGKINRFVVSFLWDCQINRCNDSVILGGENKNKSCGW